MAAELVKPGAIIDNRYELISHIGSGGFGVVYKGRQLSTGQLVAIKIARTIDETSNSGILARFRREMAVVAELSHPNIVRLIDVGHLADSRLFAVLELVRGVSLSELLQSEGPLAPTEAKHLMMQVLDALCSAHDLGVIHRDLKPANIMITSVGARRNAMVLDFGIATCVKSMRDESYQTLTPEGSVGGTPAYMAPEQLHGREPNPQTDIYAWGLVFTECLTGERVVRGSSVAETMFAHLRPEPHPLPAAVAVHPLGHILRSALAKDSSARFIDSRAALRELSLCDVSALPPLRRMQSHAQPDADTAMLATADGAYQGAIISATGVKVTPGEDSTATRSSDSRRRVGAASPSQSVVAERRQLTALVCEMGPLELLSEGLDPDELYRNLGQFRRLASTVVQQLEGVVERWEGGRLIAYFGYPLAHEDDACRAIQAALEIVRQAATLDMTLPAGSKRPTVQAGVHTGLVVTSSMAVSTDDVSIVGDVSRVAVRLQEHAESGTVLLSEDAHRLSRDRFECVSEGTRDLGVRGQTRVFRVLGVSEATALSPTARSVPAIGRESDLDSLLERWEETADGRGQVVLVSGEAGIGKSHLMSAFRQRLHGSQHLWLECLSSPYLRSSAFHPIIHGLHILFGFQRNDTVAVKRTKVLDLLEAQDLGRFQPFLYTLLEIEDTRADMPPMGGAVFRQPADEQLIDFIFALADGQPVIVAVEDLHWTDPSTLELIQALVDQAPLGAVMVLVTTRPTYVPEWRGRTHVASLPLARLPRKRVESMIRGVAGDKALPDGLVQHLATKTDGVPLFVEELTKAVLESGSLIELADRYEFTGDVQSLAIPATLRGSLMARLDRLGPAKEIAQIAAIIGREFSFGLLASITELAEHELGQALTQLVQSELVIQRGRPPDARYTFKHALVQDTAYESLLDKTRQRYHARIGDVLEEHFPDVAQSQPELLAHHYTEARLDDKAIAFWTRAGIRASERSTHVESIQQLSKCLELLGRQPESPERDQRELFLVMSLGAPLMSTRGYGASEVEQNFSRALTLCRKLGGAEEHVPVLFGLWVFYHVRASYATALELGEQLSAVAERCGDPELALTAHIAHGTSLLLTGQYPRACALLARAIAIYDPQKHGHMAFIYGQDPGMFAHSFMAWTQFVQSAPDQALASAETSIEIARRTEHPNSIAFALCIALVLFERHGHVDRVLALSEEAMALCSEYRLVHWLALAQFMNGVGQAQRGELARGIEIMRSGLQLWRATGARIILPYMHSLLAENLGKSGEVQAGIDVQQEIPAANQDGLEAYFECQWKLTHSELLRLRGQPGDVDQARVMLVDAIRIARARGNGVAEIAALTSCVELDHERGVDHGEAIARLGELLGAMSEGPQMPCIMHARRVLSAHAQR